MIISDSDTLFLGEGRGQLLSPTPLSSIISSLSFRKPLNRSPVGNPASSLIAPYVYTCFFLSLERSPPILFLANSYSPSNLNPHVSSAIKSSLRYPPPPCVGTFCMHTSYGPLYFFELYFLNPP